MIGKPMEQRKDFDAPPCYTFERTQADQRPLGLLIACTDPVLDKQFLPLIRSQPMLIWRTPGPVVPPDGLSEEASKILHFAVNEMGTEEILVCGHIPARFLRSPADGASAQNEPQSDPVFYYAEVAARIAQEKYGPLDQAEYVQAIVEENVFVQTANLQSYPTVLDAMARNRLALHRWLYDVKHGRLFGYGCQPSKLLERIAPFLQPMPSPSGVLDPCEVYLA